MLRQYLANDFIDYAKKNGRDADLATAIFSCYEIPVRTKETLLLDLQRTTSDEKLRVQLDERIAFDRRCYERFASNDGSSVFHVQVAEENDDWDSGDPVGYFASFDLALEYAKLLELEFRIDKYQIFGLANEIITPNFCLYPRLLPDVDPKKQPYGGAIGSGKYSKEGDLLHFWSDEFTQEESEKVNALGGDRFEGRFLDWNGFEKGDIVRFNCDDIVGIVSTSQAQWQAFLQRVKDDNLDVDFENSSVNIECSLPAEEWAEEDIAITVYAHPVYLERVDDIDEENRKKLLALLNKEDSAV